MAEKYKILIADNLAQEGQDILNDSGLFEVDFRKKTERQELLDIIKDYDGLIIRSATKVDKEVIDKADKLKVVIRAGVGVDNINISECSQKGIVVMNAPAGNSVSTAEQAIALMFATARNTPQANESMHQKKWEKSKFKGTQLTGKTVGVIGLGRIGKEVVKRAKGLQMKVLGYDPYIPYEHLQYLQIELVDKETVLAQSDFITVHTPLTDTTRDLINSDNLDKLKDGVRLINCARGGIYQETALLGGIEKGKIKSVGLDVFTSEPPAEDFALYGNENIIMTPHLGASTDEAQTEVAKETASSMVAFFKEGVARSSLNFPTLDPQEMDVLAPWFSLCENIGRFATQAMSKPATDIKLEYEGELTSLNLQPLEIAMTKGVLTVALGDDVNLVNAPVLAKERGLSLVTEKLKTESGDANVLRVKFEDEDGKKFQVRATVNFSGGTIIGINDVPLEFKPEGHILYMQNKDIPRVVAEISGMLGEADVNIGALQLCRDARGGTATTVIQTDEEVSKDLIKKIQSRDFIISVNYIRIPV